LTMPARIAASGNGGRWWKIPPIMPLCAVPRLSRLPCLLRLVSCPP
jgi:hypothetical protein